MNEHNIAMTIMYYWWEHTEWMTNVMFSFYYVKQETQLPLTNRATRLEILNFEKYCDFETGIKGHWRSLKMSPFDTAHLLMFKNNFGSI